MQAFLHWSCRLGDAGRQVLQCTVITELWEMEQEEKEPLIEDITGQL